MDEYLRASTPEEALRLLKQFGDKAMIIGGGTMIHDLEYRGLLSDITTLIDISRLGLNYVRQDSSGLRIGASTTFTDLLNSDYVRMTAAYGAIADALLAIRPVQIRNMATVGGAMCASVPQLDLPPTSLAMSAKVKLMGSEGDRTVEAQDFFLGFLKTALKSEEFLAEIQIPNPPPHTGSAFQKLETNAVDWATLNVATKITLGKGRRVADARIVMGGGVGEVPRRAKDAEAILNNVEPTQQAITRAAGEAMNKIEFIEDERASAEYRRKIARCIVKESLDTSITRARQ